MLIFLGFAGRRMGKTSNHRHWNSAMESRRTPPLKLQGAHDPYTKLLTIQYKGVKIVTCLFCSFRTWVSWKVTNAYRAKQDYFLEFLGSLLDWLAHILYHWLHWLRDQKTTRRSFQNPARDVIYILWNEKSVSWKKLLKSPFIVVWWLST